MPTLTAVSQHRQRQRNSGVKRLEVQVRDDDAALVRAVVAALADPARQAATRALLHGHFVLSPPISLKALLAAAPLDDIDLERPRDPGRDINL